MVLPLTMGCKETLPPHGLRDMGRPPLMRCEMILSKAAVPGAGLPQVEAGADVLLREFYLGLAERRSGWRKS